MQSTTRKALSALARAASRAPASSSSTSTAAPSAGAVRNFASTSSTSSSSSPFSSTTTTAASAPPPTAASAVPPRPTRSFSSTTTTTRSSLSDSSRPPLPPSGTRLYAPPPQAILDHFAQLLKPMGVNLNEEVALRIATHKSYDQAKQLGHGEKLAFLGRRVLRLHLTLFLTNALLHSRPTTVQQHLSQTALDRLVETKQLGATVGRELGLEKAMRWREVRGPTGEATGLFKSRGSVVEALIGAVYSQHGIQTSSKLFEALVLPHLAFPRSLQLALAGEESDLPQESTTSSSSSPRGGGGGGAKKSLEVVEGEMVGTRAEA